MKFRVYVITIYRQRLVSMVPLLQAESGREASYKGQKMQVDFAQNALVFGLCQGLDMMFLGELVSLVDIVHSALSDRLNCWPLRGLLHCVRHGLLVQKGLLEVACRVIKVHEGDLLYKDKSSLPSLSARPSHRVSVAVAPRSEFVEIVALLIRMGAFRRAPAGMLKFRWAEPIPRNGKPGPERMWP